MYSKMDTLPYAGITQIKFKGQRLWIFISAGHFPAPPVWNYLII